MSRSRFEGLTRKLRAGAPYLIFAVVFFSSFFTYFSNYRQPPHLFWDENYHIASAQKYLHGVFFMELHPPLGKLLIALGERILKPNPDSDQSLGTMYIKGELLPPGFSFAGYRFIPALLGWWTALLLFFVFYRITGNHLMAGLLCSLYIFDNAMIVHSRGAMLESPQLFFCAAFLLLYFVAHQQPPQKSYHPAFALLLGVVFGCVLAIKLNGLILALLVLPLAQRLGSPSRALKFICLFTLGAALCWLSVWQIHFYMGRTVVSTLDDQGYFYSSPRYREILEKDLPRGWMDFPQMLEDSLAFIKRHQAGVPKLNLCKADENGSPSFFWPIGARAINYRWESSGDGNYRYLYLQANPLVWWTGLLAVLMSWALLAASCFYPDGVVLKQRGHLLVFSAMYACYMLVMARLDRVMYLYHYFIPLIFSFILFALLLGEVGRLGRLRINLRHKQLGLTLLASAVCGCFFFYAPLTYYWPLKHDSFKKRAWVSLWDLTCQGCPRTNRVCEPLLDEQNPR